VGATVGRDYVVNLVSRNRYPGAVHFDFLISVYFATLGRATIHHAATWTSAVISPERRVEVPMPQVVTVPMITNSCTLLCNAQTKKDRERAA
jgi:hypothetical protein